MDDAASTYTVTELAESVARTITDAFRDEIWVKGEIRDLSRHEASGHVYFTLVDPDKVEADGTMHGAARLPVTLFSSDKDAINWKLRRSGAGRMTEGTEVRIRGAISYYPVRGTVQLRMTWIDTEFTLGRLAARRDELVRKLAAEGLLDRNASLPMPMVPLRVGLVTSEGSAAHADFVHEFEASGFRWHLMLCDARVQGADAPDSIARAIRRAARDADVVAVVRGGGAQTELAAFDHERVARAIATSDVVVVTGIGHEVDTTVADRVAHTAHKTPTAAAAALVAVVRAYLDRVTTRSQQIEHAAQRALHVGTVGVEGAARRLARDGRRFVRTETEALDRIRVRLVRGSTRPPIEADRSLRSLVVGLVRASRTICDAAESTLADRQRRTVVAQASALAAATGTLDLATARVASHDPALALSRGYAVVRDAGGAVVRTATALSHGDRLDLEFVDGSVQAVVDGEPDGVEPASGR